VSYHPLSRATHTLELDQLAELDGRLAASGSPQVSAGELGLEDDRVPSSAQLTALAWDGPPEYPYIHGHFGGSGSAVVPVVLHTEHLRRLSKAFGLHHQWGV
jgi:hypothetical protein